MQPLPASPGLAKDGAEPRPRLAASLILMRDSDQGPEVLLLERAQRPGDQNSGAAVFPGGLLDAGDRGREALCAGLTEAAACARLGLGPEAAADALAFWVAALRECFEEAGLLLACDAAGRPVDLSTHTPQELAALRQALHGGHTDLAALCAQWGVRLDAQALRYVAHWITPRGLPKIFDTRFFLARVPAGQTVQVDANEAVRALWLRPAQALAPETGLKLLNVTERTLQDLSGFADVAAALDWADRLDQVPLNRPRLGQGPRGRTPVNNDHPAYAELGRLNPDGLGDTRIELLPGVPVWLSPRVLRVTAPNGSQMTGPGTNSYFIGQPGGSDWTLLDPGPDDERHVQALLAAAPGRIARILVTHTHPDHSPAARAIAASTAGRVATHSEWQDTGFQPDQLLAEGDVLALGPDCTLQVLHTPGHASNHLCLLLREERLLFTGDHLMQGSTVVINPPDGDMAVYLQQLERLLDLQLDWLAPGHGFLIDQPHALVRKVIAHRLAREARVLQALQGGVAVGEPELLARVYAETPARLHGVALRSLRAHLIKLRDEGRAEPRGAGWVAVPAA